MPQPRYELKGSRFWIVDEELGIDVSGEVAELHGPSMQYGPGGVLLSESWFFHGKKMGRVLRYALDGSLLSREGFVEGVPHLMQEHFYPGGGVRARVPYNMGVLEGTVELFWQNGALKRKGHYVSGKLQEEEFFDAALS